MSWLPKIRPQLGKGHLQKINRTRKKPSLLSRLTPLRNILILLVGFSFYQYYSAGQVSWVSEIIRVVTPTATSYAEGSPIGERPTQNKVPGGPAIDLSGHVVRVADGDTITILDSSNTQHKIRFHGIDTPERGQPYGNAAREALAEKVAGRTVDIAVVDTDRYGRTVGRVFVDGKDVNLAMVEQGFAWWYRRYAPNDRALEAAEKSARERRLGLWREPEPIPPWEWRRARR
jgi:endonuclease YncB( thermonuclease family)